MAKQDIEVFCDRHPQRRRVKPKRDDFQGVEKVRFQCQHCHYDYQCWLAKWEAAREKLRTAGIAAISLRDLERYS